MRCGVFGFSGDEENHTYRDVFQRRLKMAASLLPRTRSVNFNEARDETLPCSGALERYNRETVVLCLRGPEVYSPYCYLLLQFKSLRKSHCVCGEQKAFLG